MLRKVSLGILLFTIFCLTAKAQFYLGGNDPSNVSWYEVQTPHFRIIYPKGYDSLSVNYGTLLEKFRESESWSTGLVPGEMYKSKTPVVLRVFHGISNGMMAWAPKRMELYTLPTTYDALPMPWDKNLAVHEERHLAQLQFGYRGAFKPLYFLFGEIIPSLAAGVYPGLHLLEGDAVVAETALTKYGRGRNADFLNYYMAAFDQGDLRNWYRWRYGSFKKFAPNHYSLGYLTVAGTRYINDDPQFMSRYFMNVSKNPFRLMNMRKEMSDLPLKKSFGRIIHTFNDIWQENAQKRSPFVKSETVCRESDYNTVYSDIQVVDNKLFALKTGKIDPPTLVELRKGRKDKKILSYSYYANSMAYSPEDNRLYWSESVPDLRWSLKMSSKIKYIELGKGNKVHNLTKKGRFACPIPCSDGNTVAAIEYPYSGGTSIVTLDSKSGKSKHTYQAPDSLQFSEICRFGDSFAIIGVSEEGCGLYLIDYSENGFSNLRNVIRPVPVTLKQMKYSPALGLIFTSDRNGVNEIYSYKTDGVTQLTSTRYGASDANISANADTLYYSCINLNGTYYYKSAVNELRNEKVDFYDIYRDTVAEKLTAQEMQLAKSKGKEWADTLKNFKTTFTERKRYSKLLNSINIHSWAPFYFNIDEFKALNQNIDYETASLGATVFYQNILGTLYGSVGYSAHNDPDGGRFRHSGHLKMTYTGMYPVFELELGFNDRSAYNYSASFYQNARLTLAKQGKQVSSTPNASAQLSIYIPFTLSQNGANIGITPRLKTSLSNDYYNPTSKVYTLNEDGTTAIQGEFTHSGGYMFSFNPSISAYYTLQRAENLSYPKFGIGGEAGAIIRPFQKGIYSNAAYAFLYGYLPGAFKVHGTKWSLMASHLFNEKSLFSQPYASFIPRGINSPDAVYKIAAQSSNQLRFSLDYAVPIYIGDISFLSPVTYITHFVLTPFADYTIFDNRKTHTFDGALYSVGATFTAQAKHFLWFPFNFEFGVECSFNGGRSFETLKASDKLMNRFYIGPVVKSSF